MINKPIFPRFPLFITLDGMPVLVAGGGKIAARRISVLKEFGASITIVSPEICESLREIIEHINWMPECYRGIDSDYTLVIAATNDRIVNRQVGVDAASLGIPVSVADSREESTFWFPGIERRGEIIVGVVSVNGNHTAVKTATNAVRKALKL